MSLEAALAEHTVALNANTAILQRVVEGQQAALAKLDGKAPTAPKPKPAATENKAPAASDAKAPETPAAAPPAETAKVVTDEDVKAAATKWMDGRTPDERKAAAGKINEMLAWMGFEKGSKLTGPEAKLTDDQRKQAKFFILRWAAGVEVDFSADYDLDGDPTQGAAVAAEEPDADPFG